MTEQKRWLRYPAKVRWHMANSCHRSSRRRWTRLGLTTHGVCTLDIIAAGIQSDVEYLVTTDARRKEVYWARYSVAGRRVEGPGVLKPRELSDRHPGIVAYGRGAALYSDQLNHCEGHDDPEATWLAAAVLAQTAEQLPLEPLYLRRPDAVPQVQVKRA